MNFQVNYDFASDTAAVVLPISEVSTVIAALKNGRGPKAAEPITVVDLQKERSKSAEETVFTNDPKKGYGLNFNRFGNKTLAVLKYVTDHPGSTCRQVNLGLGAPKGNTWVSTTLFALCEQGRVNKFRQSEGDYYIFSAA